MPTRLGRMRPGADLSCLRQYSRSGPRKVRCHAKVKVYTVIHRGFADSGEEKLALLPRGSSPHSNSVVSRDLTDIGRRPEGLAGEGVVPPRGGGSPRGTKAAEAVVRTLCMVDPQPYKGSVPIFINVFIMVDPQP